MTHPLDRDRLWCNIGQNSVVLSRLSLEERQRLVGWLDAFNTAIARAVRHNHNQWIEKPGSESKEAVANLEVAYINDRRFALEGKFGQVQTALFINASAKLFERVWFQIEPGRVTIKWSGKWQGHLL